MKKTGIRIAVVAFLFASAALLAFGQEKKSTASKQITIEELFLKSVEFQILREKAFSGDYDAKMNALDDLEKKLSEGSVGANDAQVEFVLEYLAMEGSSRLSRENGRVINYFPEVRRRAANMLGRVATEDAKNALVRVLIIDPEVMVKSEAAYALGTIGMNKDGEVVQALTFAYDRDDPTKPDNNFAYALILAIEKLSKKTIGGLKDPAAYRMLVKISQGSYLRTVKVKALQVLDELKGAK
jgi:HEAT repeat protein